MIGIALYSVLADDLEIVLCFFDLQKTNDSHKNILCPVKDLLIYAQPTQSASQKALTWKSNLARKKSHLLGKPLHIKNLYRQLSNVVL